MRDGEQTTHVLSGLPRLVLEGAVLVVVEGPDTGARYRLTAGATRVGTGAGNQLRLRDPSVSRVHLELTPSREGVRLVDVGSTNGTRVDGVRVVEALLHPNATVRIGGTTFRADPLDDGVEIPLSPAERFGDVLGASTEMRRVYATLEKIAGSDTTVLLQGETGTGKDLVARALHEASPRAAGPFVIVDAGALSEQLVESELFGHVRGAFSGAIGDRQGLFEEANGGTLFLDDVGELPQELQPKLLRVLESREVRRIGAHTARKIDVRIIAATKRSLATAVNEGSFREDLYFRLAVVEVRLPPLRARRGDVPVLIARFLDELGERPDAAPPEVIATLSTRAWAGNVRELRNFVEQAVALGWSRARPVEDSRAPPGPRVPTHLPLKEARLSWTAQFERVYIEALLAQTGGNVVRAAELGQVNRRWLQRLMAQHGLGRGPGPGVNEDE